VHSGGLRVYTSLNMDLQKAANQAVLDGVATYERRHGWKGRLKNVIALGIALDAYNNPDWEQPIETNSYVHALVTAVTDKSATVKLGRYTGAISAAEMKWTGHKRPIEIFSVGDIAYLKVVSLTADGAAKVQLEQDSGAQGALLAIDNSTGDIKAMVGGRDFDESKFNRATQALRQVGSSFKPYLYTAVMDNGGSPDDVVLDAPITFSTASGPYTPHNYDGKFEGNITLRRAIAFSRNIPALKLEQKIGIDKVIEYTRRFGITSPLPPVLPLALGAADITLYEQTAAFSTFPNDGVRVTPRYLRKVTDYDGRVLEEDYPEVKDVISAQTARVMVSLLEGVVQHGTGYAATALKHPLGGKTGTTNDFTDAWFIGFSPSITCGVWVGFDEKKTLGNRETGAMAALPIWMQFMKVALVGHDKEDFARPPEIPRNISVKLDTPDVSPGDGEAH
jgi:penicillin-binding protein 1A